jgi:hypothetical protein
VFLNGIARRGHDGKFHYEWRSEAAPFPWAPQHHPQYISLTAPRSFDFGIARKTGFSPILMYNSYRDVANVTAGNTLWYYLGVTAENYARGRIQVFEVTWDGTWDDKPEVLRNHMRLREVDDAEWRKAEGYSDSNN